MVTEYFWKLYFLLSAYLWKIYFLFEKYLVDVDPLNPTLAQMLASLVAMRIALPIHQDPSAANALAMVPRKACRMD
jgi:hypothetical protein